MSLGWPAGSASAANRPFLVYGDSLVTQSHSQLAFQLGLSGIPAVITDFPGTALCDWIPQIKLDVTRSSPSLVAIAFLGNASTQCMAQAASHGQVIEKYRSDLIALGRWLHQRRIRLMVLGAPPGLVRTSDPEVLPRSWTEGVIPGGYAPDPQPLQVMYRQVVGERAALGWEITYSNVGTAVAAQSGGWTRVLPCLPVETPAMGCSPQHLISVRSWDFRHFVIASNGWSSGAWRYALAIKAALAGVA